MNLVGERTRTDDPVVDKEWEYMVDSDSDEEEWEDEEVSYLVLDAGSELHAQTLASCKEIQISGLNTPHPYIRIGSRVFEAQHETLLGSELLLKEEQPRTSRSLEDNEQQIRSHRPFAITSKHLRMRPVELTSASDPTMRDETGLKKIANARRSAASKPAKPKAPPAAKKRKGTSPAPSTGRDSDDLLG